MKVIPFFKEKYEFPLQMDLGIIEKTPHFFFSPEVHCTDFFEILILTQGNGHVLLDTERVDLKRGVFLFISPFQKRRWFVDQKGMEGYYLIFEKDFLNTFFADKLFVYRLQYFYNRKVAPYFIPTSRLFSYEGDIFEEITYEIENYQKDSPHLLRSILYYILIKLNREYCQYHQFENDTQLNNYAFQFKEALETHFREYQQVNDYTHLLGISRISINTAVKKQFGITATEMIKDRLIFEVKSELLYSTKTVAEIGYALNFSESNNLIRLFKAKTGITPAKYRSQHQLG